MSKSFTLIELIFVIIIGAILTFVGFEYLPDNTLISDYQVLKEKILQKRSNALGYKYTGENNLTCFECSTAWFNSDDNTSSEKVHYKFKSNISCSNGINKICFDYLGRPFKDDVDDDLTNLLHTRIIITLNYKNEEKNLTLYPISGEVE